MLNTTHQTDHYDQNFAMRAVCRIFRDSYAAAVSTEGAFERVKEKICDLHRGIKNRRSDFISTEAVIHVTALFRRISFEDAKLRHNSKSKDEIAKTKSAIKNNEELWREARSFDKTVHCGQQFVIQHQEGTKIVFSFNDSRQLEFDLQHCSDDVQFWLSSIGTPNRTDEVIEMASPIKRQILEVTRWPDALIEQALIALTPEDKVTLYAQLHLSQFRNILVRKEREIDKPVNKISTQDIIGALLSLLGELDEAESG